MTKLFLFFLVFFFYFIPSAFAVQSTVSWEAPTTYTDNTLIEPEVAITLRYDIMIDGAMLFDNIVATWDNVSGRSAVFEHANADQDHYFSARARVRLLDGNWAESLWSPGYFWHCPSAGTPSTAPNLPIILGPIRRP